MSVYVGIDVHRKRCEEDPEEQSGQPGDTTQSHWSDSLLWAITLFPRGFDQVIPQVLALFLC